MSQCRSCMAKIRWVEVQPSGKLMPIDSEPAGNGTVILVGHKAFVLTVEQAAMYQGLRYVSHFATCPNASEHRK